MQKIIETGRTVRQSKKVSMKFPLKEAKLVNKDEQYQQDILLLQKYILEELNIVKISMESDESPYVQYTVEPDHREMGQNFGKAYNKQMKKKIETLSSEECEAYMRNGEIEIEGNTVKAGWLKIRKEFNKQSQNLD